MGDFGLYRIYGIVCPVEIACDFLIPLYKTELLKSFVYNLITMHLQKQHVKSISNGDLSQLFGQDILQRYTYSKLKESPLFNCVAGELTYNNCCFILRNVIPLFLDTWAVGGNYFDVLKSLSEFTSKVRREIPRNDEERKLKETMTNMKLFVCKLCAMDCETHFYLSRHIQLEHKDEFESYAFCCKMSLKHTSNSVVLYDHIRFHLDKEAFKCQECGKCMGNRLTLSEHKLQFHTVSSNLVCDTCGLGFPTRTILNRHQKTAHGPKHKCEYCQAGKKVVLV